jgi:hypothetical protein
MNRSKQQLLALYLLMLLAHQAHVYEETWGRFFLVDTFGLGLYLSINWLLLCIPVGLLFFVMVDRPLAYTFSLIYAGFMALQGIGHNVLTIVTGRYFGGFAGGLTGIILCALGLLLFRALGKERRVLTCQTR